MNLFPGKIVARGQIEAGGGMLAYDADAFDASVGAVVDVGIRAEDIVIGADGGGLPFSHEFVEELGATRVIHGTVAGQPLEFVTPAAAEITAGKTLSVRPTSPAAVHVFDPVSGRSLRRSE